MYHHVSYKTTLIASDDISISYIQYKSTMSNYHMQSKLYSLFHLQCYLGWSLSENGYSF